MSYVCRPQHCCQAWFLLLLLPPLMAPLRYLHWQQGPTGNLFTPVAVMLWCRTVADLLRRSLDRLQVPSNTAVCDPCLGSDTWCACCCRAVPCCGAMLSCRYLDAAQDLRNPLRERQRYTDYISMREDVLGKAEDVDLKAPIIICEIYGPYTVAVLGAIRAVAVSAA